MIRIPQASRRISRALFLMVCSMFLVFAKCDQDVELNLDRSINIFGPGPKWPAVKKLTPAQQQVYKTMGRPDHFRVLYDSRGEIKIRQLLEKELNGKKPKELPPYSWVYLRENKEVVFQGDSFVERQLTEPINLVIKYGDPEDVKEFYGGITQWTYYSVGKMYKIGNGRIVETKEFPAMGSVIK